MPAQAWVTLIVGIAATVGVLVSWQQRNTADRRTEWWRRTAWAFERSFSEKNQEATLGWRVLETLADSKLATRGDADVAQVIAEHTTLNRLGDDGGQGQRRANG